MKPLMRIIEDLPRPTDLLKLLSVTVLYALMAKTFLALFSANGVISIVWPPSGFALAMLLMGGKRYAVSVFLGAFLANATTNLPLGMAAIIATGNTLEALLGTWLLARDGKFDPSFQSLRDYLQLIVLAGFFGASVSAINGSTSLLISGLLTSEDYFRNLLHWWMGDAIGIFLITPLILVWRRVPKDWIEPKRMIEVILLFGLTFLIGQVVFYDWLHDSLGKVARGYWMYLLVTWAAVRLGTHGVVALVLMVATQALLGAAQGTGYFSDDMAKTQLTNYWFYMVILSISGMALATYIAERNQTEERLSESLRKLGKLATHLEVVREDEQKRIARELHDEIGGVLAALNVKVSLMAMHPPTEMANLKTEVGNLANLVATGIHSLQRTVTELRPSLLDEVGLIFAIKRYVQEFERNSEIECDLRLPEVELTLDGSYSIAIFRIIQESLTNVAKHAKASRVSIILSDWESSLVLTVKDNGKGFDLNNQKAKSFGLLGIRERAAMVGGKSEITGQVGKGTTVRVSLPWGASRQNLAVPEHF